MWPQKVVLGLLAALTGSNQGLNIASVVDMGNCDSTQATRVSYYEKRRAT